MGAGTGVYANRKKFRGTLERAQGEGAAWQIVWSDAPARKPGAKVSKHAKPLALQALGFVWDEVREARLADVVDFKGRKRPVVDEGGEDPAASADLDIE